MTRARRMAWEVTVRDIETGRVVLRRLCGTQVAAQIQASELSAEVDRDHYTVEVEEWEE